MFEGLIPGVQLGSALAAVDRSTLDGDSLLEVLIAQSRQLAHEQARLLADLVAVADAVPVPEFAPMEIGAALTWTRQAASAQLALAQDIVQRLPMVHDALLRGDLDLPKARVIADGVASLDVASARQVASTILPDASTLTTGQLRARLSKLVIAVDPDAAAVRHRLRVTGRRIVLQPDQDSCASLCAFDLPAADAVAASNRLNELAHAAKRAGDSRTMDQLRADTFLDLLLGRTHHGDRRGGVELVGSLETLTNLADAPGDIAGYGPVIADIARQIASQQRQAQWTFRITDKGHVYHGVTRRRPSAAMAREVNGRDRTCRAPGCRVPAHRADLDHTLAWELGGPTVPGNLGVLCRHHHRAKHEGGWHLHQPRPGHFVWHSPLGHRYKISPEPP